MTFRQFDCAVFHHFCVFATISLPPHCAPLTLKVSNTYPHENDDRWKWSFISEAGGGHHRQTQERSGGQQRVSSDQWPWSGTWPASSIGRGGLCDHHAAIIGSGSWYKTTYYARKIKWHNSRGIHNQIKYIFKGMVGITLVLAFLFHIDSNTHYIMVRI